MEEKKDILDVTKILLERMDKDKFDAAFSYREQFEDFLHKLLLSIQAHETEEEIIRHRNELADVFKAILRYSCVENAQKIYNNFYKTLNRMIRILKDENINSKNIDEPIVPNSMHSLSAEAEPFLYQTLIQYESSKNESFLSKSQIKSLKLSIMRHEKDARVQKLNDFIQKDINETTKNQTNSTLRLAQDVQSVIDELNQYVMTIKK